MILKKALIVNRTRDINGTRLPKTKRNSWTILVDDFIFISTRCGEPSSVSTLQNCFKPIYEKSDLKRITPHSVCHTHAMILISQRFSIKIIAGSSGQYTTSDFKRVRPFI